MRWARRWVAGALGGALLMGALGARVVPPPPPLLRFDPFAARASASSPPQPAASPEQAEQAQAEQPGAGPALIWLLPMAGQLSGAGE